MIESSAALKILKSGNPTNHFITATAGLPFRIFEIFEACLLSTKKREKKQKKSPAGGGRQEQGSTHSTIE